MECNNKDKAIRAKEVAENMFTARDIFGAMRFALEARNLFPALEGIVPMIVTFDVYISAMDKINGETDWYSVLRVDPLADDDALRKQYRRLARMLHPDKNKSIGADGAFDLVSRAWSILSDKAKRVAYHQKINAVFRTLSTEWVDPPEQAGADVDSKFTKTAALSASIQKKTAAEDASKTAQTSQSSRVWAICPRCKSRCHCYIANVNHRLMCLICQEHFFPLEIGGPVRDISRSLVPRRFLKIQEAIRRRRLGKRRLPGTSGASSAENVAQEACEEAKRKRDEEHKWEESFVGVLHVARKGYFSPAKVRRALEDVSLGSHGKARDVSRVHANIAIGSYSAELQKFHMDLDIEEISRKLEELKPGTDDSQKVNEAGEGYLRSTDTCDQDSIEKSEDRMSGSQATKPFAGTTTMAEMVAENFGKMSIDVKDTSVKEAANEDKKEANVADLINDVGKLGEEKKGNDKVSRE